MPDLSAIDELLERARSGLDRVPPEQLGDEIAGGASSSTSVRSSRDSETVSCPARSSSTATCSSGGSTRPAQRQPAGRHTACPWS